MWTLYILIITQFLSISSQIPYDDQYIYDDFQLAHEKLKRDLFAHYDKNLKPRRDPHEAVNVTFSLHLNTLLELNEPGQYLEMHGWAKESWTDEFCELHPYNAIIVLYLSDMGPNEVCEHQSYLR